MSVPQSNSTLITDSPTPDELRTACTPVAPLSDRLQRKGDQRLDLFRRQARRFGHHRDPRAIEIGKHVDRQVDEHVAAIDEHSQGNDGRQQRESEARCG